MSSLVSRIMTSACILVAMLTVGAPHFTALDRAVSGLFVSAIEGAPASATAPGPVASRPAPGAPTSRTGSLQPRWAQASGTMGDTVPVDVEHVSVPMVTEGPGIIVPALYASFLTLQVLDIHSTLAALDRGATERNPIMAPFADHPAGLVALKLGTAAGVLYMTERVRRRSQLGAIVMMAAFNSAYLMVVSNNYRVANAALR